MDTWAAILCILLGAPDCPTRVAAEEQLAALGALAWPALEDAARSVDPEVRLRAGRLVIPLRHGWLERHLARRSVPLPWIDALPLDRRDRQQIMDHYIFEDENNHGSPTDEDRSPYREATRKFLSESADTCTIAELADLLRRMDARAACWLQTERRYSDETEE